MMRQSSMLTMLPVRTAGQFEAQQSVLARNLLDAHVFDRGEVHAQQVRDWTMETREVRHVILEYEVSEEKKTWAEVIQPNLPWAEDHFHERTSGKPLNPPPSHEYWPFNRNANEEHRLDGKFSHSYPERFWPRKAGDGADGRGMGHVGIRFEYGDLGDMLNILRRNPRTRQAYLPVWFPEDLAAANYSQRVPCTLGYHFLMHPAGYLDCSYFLRSCDFVRFMQDDVYMAGRLLQWVVHKVNAINSMNIRLETGRLYVHIDNLHAFRGDEPLLRKLTGDDEEWGSAI